MGVSHGIALTWIPLYLTDDKSALVQVMTWCPQAASHYLSKWRPRSVSTYGVTGPQWVNKLFIIFTTLFFSRFTPQYPQIACLSTQSLYSHQHICFLCHLLSFHNKKHHLNLLSSITKALLTHTLASFWRKQSCLLFCESPWWWGNSMRPASILWPDSTVVSSPLMSMWPVHINRVTVKAMSSWVPW